MILNLTDLSDEPLQSQIVRQVRAKVLSGELKAKESLPSIRELARTQKVSVITVQRGYETLEREGLIRSRRGKGFFVMELNENDKISMASEGIKEKLKPVINSALDEGMTDQAILKIVKELLTR